MNKFPIKWFDSELMQRAPVMSGTIGAFADLLHACLITGFGTILVNKITVINKVASVQVGTGETFAKHSVIDLQGTGDPILEGEHRVTQEEETSFSWETDAQDGTYTGTFTIKYAPVGGWERVFHDGNRVAYRSTDPESSGEYLYVDDTVHAQYARICGYTHMDSIDEGFNAYPSDALAGSGGYVRKSHQANSSARKWTFTGCSRFFMWSVASHTSSGRHGEMRGFGDVLPLTVGSVSQCILSVRRSNDDTYGYYGALIGHTEPASNSYGGTYRWDRITDTVQVVNLMSVYNPSTNGRSGRDDRNIGLPDTIFSATVRSDWGCLVPIALVVHSRDTQPPFVDSEKGLVRITQNSGYSSTTSSSFHTQSGFMVEGDPYDLRSYGLEEIEL